MSRLRWLLNNLSTLLLSFVLALIVWASALITSDPNQEGTFGPVPIEIIGQPADMLLTNDVPEQATINVRAPQSIWSQLNNNPAYVRAWIDLAGLDTGQHVVNLNAQVDLKPNQILSIDPSTIQIVLEPLTTSTFPVDITIIGEPPFGYQRGETIIDPGEVTISGPESAVKNVARVIASVSISGNIEPVKTTVAVRPVDQNGNLVSGLTISPKDVKVTVPISILGGYKNVAVKVLTKGQVSEGYRLTNITVTPPTVTLYSSNPQLVNELPGFIETNEVDITGLTDDAEFNASLNLPEGVILVSEPSVLVQVGVAAIESSLKFSLRVELLGLPPELVASISPPVVDVIVSGPLPVLDTLTEASFRVVVDLTDLTEGTYQVAPVLDLVPDNVQVDTIIPEFVQVIISVAPTPTPTLPPTSTPRPGASALPTPTPTIRP